jgi:hypothetical protein
MTDFSGPTARDQGVHCFSGEIEQSSLDSAEGRPTETDNCGDKTRKTPVVINSVVYVTVNVLSVPRFPPQVPPGSPQVPVPRFPVPRFPTGIDKPEILTRLW